MAMFGVEEITNRRLTLPYNRTASVLNHKLLIPITMKKANI